MRMQRKINKFGVLPALFLTVLSISLNMKAIAATPAEAEAEIRETGVQLRLSEEEITNALNVFSQLQKEGLPVNDARDVIRISLKEDKRGQDVADVAKAFSEAAKEGLGSENAFRIVKTSLKEGLNDEAIDKLLDETVLTVNEGASFQEVRHVVKQALQKGGETAAFNALETFRKLVAEGVDEHEARKEVTRMIKHSSRENRELKAEDTRGQHKEEHQTRHRDRSRERHEIEPERHGVNEIEPERHGVNEIEPERHGLTENEVKGNDDTNHEVRHQRNDDTKPEHD